MQDGVSVSWRPHDAAEWRPLLAVPAINGGFQEIGRYVFQISQPMHALCVDDEPLRGDGKGGWVWEPGFYAGQVLATVITQEGVPTRAFALDVAPDPSKVGNDIFSRMLDEIWAQDPSLIIGSEPATRQIGELGSMENPWLAFARLRRYGPEFVQALDSVRSRPRKTLQVRRALVPLREARRVDRRTGMVLLRNPGAAAFVPSSAASEPASVQQVLLDVPTFQQTFDSAANRALLALLHGALRRIRSVQHRLEQQVSLDAPSETRTALSGRWPSRRAVLESLHQTLATVARQLPFRDVTRPEITAAGLTAVSADPDYARAWGRGWRALRLGVDAKPTDEQLWISPTWEIYERWCFVHLRTLLIAAAPGLRWRSSSRFHETAGDDGTHRISFALQPTFRSSPVPVEGRWSVSRQREPDMLLTVETDRGMRFGVFDAKYRVSRANVLEAMSSAHIYQDSLRVGGARPTFSILLVPAAGGAPWLEAPEFQERHGVGVLPVGPDTTFDVTRLLAQLSA